MPLTVNGDVPTSITHNGRTVYRVKDSNGNLLWPDHPGIISAGSISVTLGTYNVANATGGVVILPQNDAQFTRGVDIAFYEGIKTSKLHASTPRDEYVMRSDDGTSGAFLELSTLRPTSISGIPSGYVLHRIDIEEEGEVWLYCVFRDRDRNETPRIVDCKMSITRTSTTFRPSDGRTFKQIADDAGVAKPWRMVLVSNVPVGSVSYSNYDAVLSIEKA